MDQKDTYFVAVKMFLEYEEYMMVRKKPAKGASLRKQLP